MHYFVVSGEDSQAHFKSPRPSYQPYFIEISQAISPPGEV